MKRTHSMLRRLVGLGLALGLLLALPGVAYAQDNAQRDTTDQVTDHETDRPDREEVIRKAKARALEAIERRLSTLDRLADVVSHNRNVTAEHKRQLIADYEAAASGLRGLAAEIEAADTLAEVLRLSGLIVTDYRVYLVVVPKSHEVVASDAMVAIAGRFGEMSEKLQKAINRAHEAGFDVTEAQRWLDIAAEEIAAAERKAGPVAGNVIGLQASDWPDPAQGQLREGREVLKSAGTDLREARLALQESLQALRQAIGSDRPSDRVAGEAAPTDG